MKTAPSDIRQAVLRLMRDPNYRPADKIEMCRQLGLKANQRIALRRELGELERAGEIARIRKDRYILPSEADLITGTISIHQSGFGFLNTEKPGQPDIFIAAENTGTAMNGDRVVARINRDVAPRRRSDRALKTEGRIIRILERAHDTAVGTLQQSRNFYYVVPDDPRLVHNIYVAPPVEGQRPTRSRKPDIQTQPAAAATAGDKVVVRLLSWESRHVNPEGEIVEVLGRTGAPGVDLLSVVRSYHLPTEFPKSVIDEANRIPPTVQAAMLENRQDLRDQFIVTIDPDDARDFD